MPTDPNETSAAPAAAAAPKPRRRWLGSLFALVVFGIFAYTQLTIFVIQPIGAVPEGRTIVMWRLGKLKFIDSADAACVREMGGVNLLCRGGMLAGVANNSNIIMRLPYSETLYLISTGGKTYDR